MSNHLLYLYVYIYIIFSIIFLSYFHYHILKPYSKNYLTGGNHVLVNMSMLLFSQLLEFNGKCNADLQNITITIKNLNIVQFFNLRMNDNSSNTLSSSMTNKIKIQDNI